LAAVSERQECVSVSVLKRGPSLPVAASFGDRRDVALRRTLGQRGGPLWLQLGGPHCRRLAWWGHAHTL